MPGRNSLTITSKMVHGKHSTVSVKLMKLLIGVCEVSGYPACTPSSDYYKGTAGLELSHLTSLRREDHTNTLYRRGTDCQKKAWY